MATYASGSSDSWQNQQKHARELAGVHNKAKGYLPLSEMSEEAVCKTEYFDSFSEWLVEEYEMSGGGGLKHPSVINYLQIILQDSYARFHTYGTDTSKLFLSCVSGSKANTESAKWLRKVKAKITQVISERLTQAGELLDGSETPIYLPVLMETNTSYAKAGTSEANMRKFVLTTSQRAVSRAGEVSLYSKHITLFVDVFQLSCCDLPQLNSTRFFHI